MSDSLVVTLTLEDNNFATNILNANKGLTTFKDTIKATSKEISKFKTEASNSFKKVNKDVKKMKDSLKATSRQVKKFKNTAASGFKKASKDVKGFKKSLKTTSTQMKNFKKDAKNSFSQANKGIKKFKDSMKSSTKQAKKFEKSVKASFKAVNKSMGKKVKNPGLDNLDKNSDKAKKGLKGIGSELKIKDKLKKAFNPAVIKQFVGESVDAAKVQIQAETMLASTMKRTKGVTNEQINSVKKYASELQKSGVISDEATLAGTQQLSTYKLQANTLKTLMPGMLDLAAAQNGLNATSSDTADIGGLLGQAMQGELDGVKGLGVEFTKAQENMMKYGTEQQKAATLAQVVGDQVGGMNQSLAQTDLGAIQQANNAFTTLKEEVGKAVLPVLGTLASYFAEKLPQWIDKLKPTLESLSTAFNGVVSFICDNVMPVFEDIGDLIFSIAEEFFPSLGTAASGIATTIEPIVSGALSGLRDILSWMKDNSELVSAAVLGVVGAFLSFKLITMALNIQQMLLNTTMKANPIGLIATLIGGLITVGVLLWKNWDVIKQKLGAFWAGLKGKFMDGVNFVKQKFTDFKDFMAGIGEGIANLFVKPINFIIDLINKIQIKVPDWVPGIGGKTFGFNIPTINNTPKNQSQSTQQIAKNALGTSYFSGGWSFINERGGEIINLPNGSQVIPADKSEKLINNMTSNKQSIIININGTDRSTEDILGEMVPQLKLALSNLT